MKKLVALSVLSVSVGFSSFAAPGDYKHYISCPELTKSDMHKLLTLKEQANMSKREKDQKNMRESLKRLQSFVDELYTRENGFSSIFIETPQITFEDDYINDTHLGYLEEEIRSGGDHYSVARGRTGGNNGCVYYLDAKNSMHPDQSIILNTIKFFGDPHAKYLEKESFRSLRKKSMRSHAKAAR